MLTYFGNKIDMPLKLSNILGLYYSVNKGYSDLQRFQFIVFGSSTKYALEFNFFIIVQYYIFNFVFVGKLVLWTHTFTSTLSSVLNFIAYSLLPMHYFWFSNDCANISGIIYTLCKFCSPSITEWSHVFSIKARSKI